MANNVIFMDGAELNCFDKWTYARPSFAGIEAAKPGMSGAYCFRIDQTYSAMYKNLLSNKSELWFNFRWYCTLAGSVVALWAASDDASTPIFTLTRSATGYLEARRGTSGGTIVATGSQLLNINTTYLIQIHYKPLNSGGVFQVLIDKNSAFEINYSGDTTNGQEHIRFFGLGDYGSGGASTFGFWDDIIVDDGGWIGQKRIASVLYPTGVGYQAAEWTPSTGANWQCIDERPPVDTDYNWTNTLNAEDWHTLSDITGTIASIFAVQINARVAYEGSPTPGFVQLGLRTHLTDYIVPNVSPGSSFGPIESIRMKNPYTNVNFTEAEINALEIGYRAGN